MWIQDERDAKTESHAGKHRVKGDGSDPVDAGRIGSIYVLVLSDTGLD